ncbi:MAG: hypothetical protein GTN99_07035 [Candidatus Dadabacteria bacterium]|nr:hypothetical protein [Candidatus Dadabacteria bacterium]
MTISSYSELKTGLQNWSARTDSAITSRHDEFIDMCENSLFYGMEDPFTGDKIRPLRNSNMQTTTDLTVNAQEVAKPSDYLSAIRLYIDGTPQRDLEYLAPDQFWSRAGAVTTSKPYYYTIEGDNFVFGPSPDSSYTGKLLYYAKFSQLSDSNTTNWLITNYPNVYLFGSLLHLYIYLRDDNEAKKALSLYKSFLNGLNEQQEKERASGSVLRQRPDYAPTAGNG